IPALAHHFLDTANQKMSRKLRGFTNAALDRIVANGWSGNVRELENEIQRAVALAGDAEAVSLDMLSEHLREGARGAVPAAAPPEIGEMRDLNVAVDELKRRMIQDALRDTGSKTKAADRLGIPRQSLQKMMKRLGLAGGDD